MNRRHLRAQYRRYLATYAVDSLPRPSRTEQQLMTCQFDFDGSYLVPTLGLSALTAQRPGLALVPLSLRHVHEHGLTELMAWLQLVPGVLSTDALGSALGNS